MAPGKLTKRRHGVNNKFKGVSVQEKRRKLSGVGGEVSDPDLPSTSSVTGERRIDHGEVREVEGAFSRKMKRCGTPTEDKKTKTPSRATQKRKSLPSRAIEPTGYRLIDMGQLSRAVLEAHVCPEGQLLIREDPVGVDGLCSTVYFCCSVCGIGTPMKTSARAEQRGKSYDINRRMSFACTSIGQGQQGLLDLCAILGMPPPVNSKSYKMHIDRIFEEVSHITEVHMMEAAQRLRKHLVEEDDNIPLAHLVDDKRVMDVAVTYDGTWMKRGFTANYGVGVVMSIDTGEVLDVFVCSKVCEVCKKREKDDHTTAAYIDWETHHKASGDCQKNYEGSSPGMETFAAQKIWERSIDKHNLRYRWMICDGDSKSHSSVESVYGSEENDLVVKLDCIGHVGKRMFKALDKLKKTTKGKLADGKFVGGKKGRLTSGPKGAISNISELYRNAIRQNKAPDALSDDEKIGAAVKKMQDAIMAILYHEVKIADNHERHQYCPDGDDSWCSFKRDGVMTDKDHHLDAIFLNLLKPTFERLSEEGLLLRCLPGYTQNQNESFNSLIWARCPKHRWRGPIVLNIAVYLAIMQWDCGTQTSRQLIMRALNLPDGTYTETLSKRNDELRQYVSDKAATDAEKRFRRSRALKHASAEKAAKKREGTTYGFAAFAVANSDSDSDSD